MAFLDHQKRRQESKIVWAFTSVVFLIALMMFTINMFNHDRLHATVAVSYLLLSLLLLLIYKVWRSFDLWSHIFLIYSYFMLLVLFFTGGTEGAGVLWTFIFPPLAFQLRPYRQAFVYAVIFVISMAFLFVVSPEGFYPLHFKPVFVVVQLIILGGLSGFLFFISRGKEQNQALLSESEKRFHSLFDHLSMGVALIAPDLRVLEGNHTLKHWFPDLDNFSTPFCFQTIGAGQQNEHCSQCIVKQSLADGKTHVTESVVVIGGRQRIVRVTASPIRDQKGIIYAALETIEDITDHDRARKALRDSDKIFQHAPDFLCILTFDGQLKTFNPAWQKFFGKKVEKMNGQSVFQLIVDDDIAFFRKQLIEVAAVEGAVQFDCRAVDAENKTRWLSWKLVSDAVSLQIYAFAADVTSVREDARLLAESEKRLSNLIASLPGFVYRCSNNPDWTMQYLSPGCLNVLGYSADELINNNKISFGDLILPEDRQNVWEAWQKAIAEDCVYEGEYRILHPDGSIRWMWERGSARRLSNGDVDFLEGFITEITEMKNATMALKKSEERFRNLFNNNHVVMLLIDPRDGSIVSANPAATAYYGYPSEVILHMNINQINTLSSEEIRLKMKEAMEKQQNFFLFKHRLSSGELRDVEVFSGQVYFDDRLLLYSIIHDVTEAQKAVLRLRDSEEKFRILTESASAGIYLYRNNLFISINPAVTRITGFTESELLSKSFKDVVHPDDRQMVENYHLNRLAGKSAPNRYQLRIIAADGTVRWLDHSAEFLVMDDAPTIIGTFFDITDQKKAVEALMRSEERYRLITNNTADVIWVLNLTQHKFTFISPSIEQLRGITVQQALHEPVERSMTPESWQKVQHILNDVYAMFLKTGDRVASQRITEIQLLHGDGRLINVEIATHMQFNEMGEVEIVGVSRNIDERKRMEAAISLNAAFQHMLANVSRSIIQVSDNNLNEVMVHALQEAAVFLGVERAFVIEFDENTTHFGIEYEWSAVHVSGVKERVQNVLVAKFDRLRQMVENKEEIFVSDTSVIADRFIDEYALFMKIQTKTLLMMPLVKDQVLLGYLGFDTFSAPKHISQAEREWLHILAILFADAMLKIKLDAMLRENAAKLAQSNVTKDRLFSIISHDLRSPFTSFIGLSELMAQDDMVDTMDEMRKYASQLHTLALSTYDLLDNLLQWSRLQRNELKINLRVQSLHQTAEIVSKAMNPLANQHAVRLTNEVPEDLTCAFDAAMMEIVLRNLVANAIKFTPSGGKVTLNAALLRDDLVEISVSDTGIGMPPQMVNSLFELRPENGRPGLRGERSSGLGMMLCKEFIEQHHGAISVSSVEHKGTRVIIQLIR